MLQQALVGVLHDCKPAQQTSWRWQHVRGTTSMTVSLNYFNHLTASESGYTNQGTPHLTQHVTASKLLSASDQPSGSAFKSRTKKLSSCLFFASSAAFMPCPVTLLYFTSGGRCDTQLLMRSSTAPPAEHMQAVLRVLTGRVLLLLLQVEDSDSSPSYRHMPSVTMHLELYP